MREKERARKKHIPVAGDDFALKQMADGAEMGPDRGEKEQQQAKSR